MSYTEPASGARILAIALLGTTVALFAAFSFSVTHQTKSPKPAPVAKGDPGTVMPPGAVSLLLIASDGSGSRLLVDGHDVVEYRDRLEIYTETGKMVWRENYLATRLAPERGPTDPIPVDAPEIDTTEPSDGSVQ